MDVLIDVGLAQAILEEKARSRLRVRHTLQARPQHGVPIMDLWAQPNHTTEYV